MYLELLLLVEIFSNFYFMKIRTNTEYMEQLEKFNTLARLKF